MSRLINGVAVPNEMKAERTFLVAMAINNLKLLNGSCSVGDVRIGEEIKVSSEFEELLEKGGADERVIIWTDQRATNHYEAYSLHLFSNLYKNLQYEASPDNPTFHLRFRKSTYDYHSKQ